MENKQWESSLTVFGSLTRSPENHGWDAGTRFSKCNICSQVEPELHIFEHFMLCHTESERINFYKDHSHLT